MRTSPPVLLARHSEVSLPNGGCSFEVSCAPDALLKSLSTEPLLVELYHKDKYATDVLLGIATVDLTEVLGVPPRAGKPGDFPRPAADQVAGSLVRSLELSAGVAPPAEPHAAIGESERSRRHVALVHVAIRLEELGPAPQQQIRPNGAKVAPRVAIEDRRPLRDRNGQTACHAGAASAGAEGGAGGAQTPTAALFKWREREEGRWQAALKKRQARRGCCAAAAVVVRRPVEPLADASSA